MRDQGHSQPQARSTAAAGWTVRALLSGTITAATDSDVMCKLENEFYFRIGYGHTGIKCAVFFLDELNRIPLSFLRRWNIQARRVSGFNDSNRLDSGCSVTTL